MRKSLRLPTFLCAAAICLLASAGQYARAGEDEVARAEKELQVVTDRYTAQVDELVKNKEAELLEV